MMKKVLVLFVGTALWSSSVWADDDLALLKEQLQRLSARVTQLEAQIESGKGDRLRIAQLEKQLQIETVNSTRIAQLEKQVEQGMAAPTAVVARIEELEKKPSVPQWALNTKIKGDFRYRYENTEVAGGNTKDRQRVRARIGAYGKVNDYVDYGVRFATGGDSATSANETQGDGFLKDDAMFDLYYVDIHPEQFKGAHVLFGKMKKPWLKGTGLIWDGDINPEGIAATYNKTFSNGVEMITSAGSFVMEDNKGDDTQLWSAQLAFEKKFDKAKVLAGASLYHAQNSDEGGLPSGFNTAGTDFNIVEGFGSVGTKMGNLPVKFHGQYVMNTDAASSDDTAYLLGVVFGKAKAPGTWQIGYNYRDTGRDAVMDAFNDSDFAGGDTGSCGHQIKAKYQIAKNWQAGATYFNTVNGDGDDEDMAQLDLKFKF